MLANPNIFITRVDTKRGKQSTHGWEFRIHRLSGVIEEFFSDSKYGGKDEALKEARRFRNSKLKEFPKLDRREVAELRKKNNPNKKIGVSLVKQTDRRTYGIYEYWYYQAYWSPSPGVHKARRFSVNKYGDAKAYKLACEVRDKGLRDMKI
jgi:hypothetical protein